MSVSTPFRLSPSDTPIDPEPPSADPGAGSDPRPSESRLMWWLIALFICMVYLVPFDSINLPLKLPINSQLDRVVLGVIFLIWLGAGLIHRRGTIQFRHSPINVAVFVFVALCFVSIAANLGELGWNGDLGSSVKQFALSLTYIVFLYIVATSLRPGNVEPLLKLLVFVAVVSAVGTIYEYRSNVNLFYELAGDIFRTIGATVQVSQVTIPGQRAIVLGPTAEGLANATMLAAAVPFAVAFMARARTLRATLGYALATCLLLTACIATGKKTALIIPIISLIVMVCHEPRRYARFWPLLVIVVGVIVAAAPHAISSLVYQLHVAKSTDSTTERTGDYSAVAPYIASHLLFGTGYGSFNPQKYRILDDTMLGLLIQIGALGTVAYAAVIGTVAYVASRCSRVIRGAPSSLMAAAVGVSVGFFVSNFLYDASGFRQGPYVFFFVAGVILATSGTLPGEGRPFWRRAASPDAGGPSDTAIGVR